MPVRGAAVFLLIECTINVTLLQAAFRTASEPSPVGRRYRETSAPGGQNGAIGGGIRMSGRGNTFSQSAYSGSIHGNRGFAGAVARRGGFARRSARNSRTIRPARKVVYTLAVASTGQSMIAEETIQAVLERVNLVELVGEQVALRRQGSSFVGLCPFHAEKSGSFFVRDGDGRYHCFGCGASGNVFSFVMQTRGLSFPEAVEELAQRYGIEVKRSGGGKRETPVNRDGVYRLHQIAADYFQRSLTEAPAVVRAYVAERRLSPEAIAEFGIGYAPDARTGLVQILRAKKVPDDLMVLSGLVRRSSSGDLYDTFRARVTFPIRVDRKRIAAFGGRIVPALVPPEMKHSIPKYLNSPENPVYQKSKVLFGLPQAYLALREAGNLYVVEGYMDVVSLWQVGVQNVVATCGTALTAAHVHRLSRLVRRVTVMFDGDNAGQAAAAKSFQTFLNSGLDAAALLLPEEDDPDTLALRLGGETKGYLDALPRTLLFDCQLGAIYRQYDVTGAEGLGTAARGKVAEEIATIVKQVQNPVERGLLVERAASSLRIERRLFEELVRGGGGRGAQPLRSPGGSGTASSSAAPQLDSGSPAESAVPQKLPVTELPRVDQEILLCVMAKHELLERVLRDGGLCGGLHRLTLHFLTALQRELQGASAREQVRQLLADMGPTWVAHWKKAYGLAATPSAALSKGFDDCVLAVRKGQLKQLIRQLDEQIAGASSEEQKMTLFQEKVSLSRKLGELHLPGVSP